MTKPDDRKSGASSQHDPVDTPYARRIRPEDDRKEKRDSSVDKEEDEIDQAIEETFPASDPVPPKQIT